MPPLLLLVLLLVSLLVVLSRLFACSSPNPGKGSGDGGSGRVVDPAGAATAALTTPPCLPCLPLLGSLHMLAGRGALHLTLHKLAKRYGPVFALRLGGHPALVVSALGPAREVLLRKGRLFAGRPHMVSTDLVSHGGRDIAFADASPEWRFHRKVVHSALYGARPPGEGSLHDIVSREARGLVAALEVAGSGGARALDPGPCLSRAVTAVMLALVFGAAGPEEAPEEAEVERVLHFNRGIVETAARNHPVDLFPWLQATRVVFVFVRRCTQVFPIAHLRRLRACVAVRDEFLQQKLREHKVAARGNGVRALLALLLEARREAEERGGESGGGESGGGKSGGREPGGREPGGGEPGGGEQGALRRNARRLTDEHVLMTVADVFGAGVETTVTSLRWLLAYLVHHPEVQARVHAELDEGVTRGCAPRASDRAALPHLAAAILEAQRVRPVAPLLIPHVATEDTSVGNFAVAKGTRVLVNMWSIHHDETAWPNPERFDPGRFLRCEGGRLQAGAPEGSSFLPFGGGPRVCLGEPLARLQLLLMSAALLQRFRFEPPRAGEGGGPLLPDLAGECGVVLHPRPYLVHAVPRGP